jgi:diketogulonate reductase-like aldo/keto reductase
MQEWIMVTFPDGDRRSSLGLGTWRMGEASSRRKSEIAAVRAALDMGWRVIDTAEMYGEGGAEEIVGAAVQEALRAGSLSREELFVVSKVYPHNASASGVHKALERSLGRLRLDHLDAYLLHWRGSVPLAETVGAFESLRQRGRIRHWGVSNFDLDDMRELIAVDGGDRCATNQIYYSLTARGPAFDLVPWQQARGIVTMAYSPVDQGRLTRNDELSELARSRGASAAQIALAWLAAQPGVMAIPKAVREAHLRENLEAESIVVSADDTAKLDAMFPPPGGKTALAMI